MKTVAELVAAYPYMFASRDMDLTIHRGWFPTFAKLCEDIDALLGEDKRGFKWIQLKEKFGAARWYCRWDMREGESRGIQISVQQGDGTLKKIEPNLNQASIQGLINLAEEETAKQCIVCGEPGKVTSPSGWLLCLCAGHSGALSQGRKLPNFYFNIGHDDPLDPWGECGGS